MSDNSSCPVTYHCSAQGTVLPLVNESNWSDGFRATIYLVGLLWSFMAVALIADIFMCAIEVITSKTTEVRAKCALLLLCPALLALNRKEN